jgi:plasmid stability protein
VGDVLVHDVEDEIIDAHARRAAARGISLEDELRDSLRSAVLPETTTLLERMDRCRAMTPSEKRTPVADIIRSIRDEA